MPDQALTDDRIPGLLGTLAGADPDFATFAQQHAGLGERPLTDQQAAALWRELLNVLRASPEQAQRIDRLAEAPNAQRFDAGLVSVPALVAVAFLLRTHIRCKRRADGKWEFLIEHKPADSKLLTQLLKRLAALLPEDSGAD